jgi:hypothetical protein
MPNPGLPNPAVRFKISMRKPNPMADENETVRVNISLDNEAFAKIDEVLASLGKAGLKVGSVRRALGIISGSVDAEKLAILSEVKGVTVERDETVQIPPPDSPLQ